MMLGQIGAGSLSKDPPQAHKSPSHMSERQAHSDSDTKPPLREMETTPDTQNHSDRETKPLSDAEATSLSETETPIETAPPQHTQNQSGIPLTALNPS